MPSPPDTITEAKRRLATCAPEELATLLRRYAKDPRAGVRKLAETYRARSERVSVENARLVEMMARQRELHELGLVVVAGVDEVGRGALAGPVTAGSVVLSVDTLIVGLNDSKKLTPVQRERLADIIRTRAVAYAVAHATAAEIDTLGIGGATRLAWQRSLSLLALDVDHVLIDGNDPGRLGVPTTPVVGGDAIVAAIAAASILAKVERDTLMLALADEYPAYGFDLNKGYGTAEHVDAIRTVGASPVHRLSFSPCAVQDSLF